MSSAARNVPGIELGRISSSQKNPTNQGEMITAEMTWKKSFQPQVENEPCVLYSCEPIEKGESFSFSTAQDDAKKPR